MAAYGGVVNPWFRASHSESKSGKQVQIYSPRLPLEALHLARPSSPQSTVASTPTSGPLLTLYTSICYAVALCATADTNGGSSPRRNSLGPLLPPLPWLYLTSIIKINRPISYVKYYPRASLNILSLSTPTIPRLDVSFHPVLARTKGNGRRTSEGRHAIRFCFIARPLQTLKRERDSLRSMRNFLAIRAPGMRPAKQVNTQIAFWDPVARATRRRGGLFKLPSFWKQPSCTRWLFSLYTNCCLLPLMFYQLSNKW